MWLTEQWKEHLFYWYDIFFIKILKNEFTYQEQTNQIPKSNPNAIPILIKYSILVRFLQFQATWY